MSQSVEAVLFDLDDTLCVYEQSAHEVLADALDCAPSTAAEHLRKAESSVLQSVFGR